MKKPSVTIGIGAALFAVFAIASIFKIPIENLLKFEFSYIPMVIIAVGLVWGVCSKAFNLPQKIFAICYVVLILVQGVFLSLNAADLFKSLPYAYRLSVFVRFPFVFMTFPFALFVMFAKGWQNKVGGILLLAYWILSLSNIAAIYAIFKIYPIINFIYIFTKYIKQASGDGRIYGMFIMGFLALSGVWIAFCAFTNRLMRKA